jgi:hypothetical protein
MYLIYRKIFILRSGRGLGDDLHWNGARARKIADADFLGNFTKTLECRA